MASINVKVPVKKVVDALEAKVEELKAHPEKEKQFEAEQERWKKNVAASIPDDSPPTEVAVTQGGYQTPKGFTKVVVTYVVRTSNLPKEPVQDIPSYRYNQRENDIQEIENALRLLKMTDETHVNASTFKSISKYL